MIEDCYHPVDADNNHNKHVAAGLGARVGEMQGGRRSVQAWAAAGVQGASSGGRGGGALISR